jgi:anti-sigma factor RsiW
MRRVISCLLIVLVAPAMLTAEPRNPRVTGGPIARAADRAIDRLVRASPPTSLETPQAQPQPPVKQRGNWVTRHPAWFGSLVGFAIGCPLGASQVGGSKDTFFNAFDEFACPVVGGMGAAAGALIGWAIGRR